MFYEHFVSYLHTNIITTTTILYYIYLEEQIHLDIKAFFK